MCFDGLTGVYYDVRLGKGVWLLVVYFFLFPNVSVLFLNIQTGALITKRGSLRNQKWKFAAERT